MQQALDWSRAVARSLHIGGLEVTPSRMEQTLHLPCARGHKVDFHITKRYPPEIVAKKLVQAGWTIRSSKLICPDHSRKKKDIGMTEAQVEACQIEEEEEMTTEATDKAKAAQRDAFAWLTEAFDVEKGNFRAGASDGSIAKETGLSEAAIVTMREQFFGPLKEPSELAEFRAALEKCRGDITASNVAMVRSVEALGRRLDAICRKNGWLE